MADKRKRREQRKQDKKKKARAFQDKFRSEKRPKILSDPTARANKYPRWQFNRCDWHHSEWGWVNIATEQWQELSQKLGHFETMTWGQIEGDANSGSHLVEIAECPNPAPQKRLEKLNLDDIDTLFSLRLAGAKRIYGIFGWGYPKITLV